MRVICSNDIKAKLMAEGITERYHQIIYGPKNSQYYRLEDIVKLGALLHDSSYCELYTFDQSAFSYD